MRAQVIAVVGALVVLATTSCTDQGNLVIRCPDAGGAVQVSDGQVTIDAVVMRVAADLIAPAAVADGMSFAIDLKFPDSSSTRGPRVECVRVALEKENARWDAVPRLTEETRDGSSARVRSTGRDGPHWRPEDLVDVTIWLRTASGRHVITLGRQPIH
jgi:hypothetical protein